MKLCKHADHHIVKAKNGDYIWEPRYSTKDVLIYDRNISEGTEHYLLHFSKARSEPEWQYFSYDDIKDCRKQVNGGIEVYILPMSRTQEFEPIKDFDNCKKCALEFK